MKTKVNSYELAKSRCARLVAVKKTQLRCRRRASAADSQPRPPLRGFWGCKPLGLVGLRLAHSAELLVVRGSKPKLRSVASSKLFDHNERSGLSLRAMHGQGVDPVETRVADGQLSVRAARSYPRSDQ